MSSLFGFFKKPAPPPARKAHAVILTGIPRSGTTLSCFLLNQVPNVVALHEPLNLGAILELKDHAAMAAAIDRAFDDFRENVLTRQRAVSRHVAGQIPDNHVPDQTNEAGLRVDRAEKGEIEIAKELTPDFALVIKHPMPFTALLASLRERFECYALIRNPLSVLGSWNSVAMEFRKGHGSVAERLDASLRARLAALPDRHDRQIALLEWFFAQYARLLPPERVLRYEDIVATGGRALAPIAPGAAGLAEPLRSKNQSSFYDAELQRTLARRLQETEGAFWNFYARESVDALLA